MDRTLQPLTADQAAAYRRTGTISTAAMVNACAHDCDPLTWPYPAEAATEIGADDDDDRNQFGPLGSPLALAWIGASLIAIVAALVKVFG